MRIEGKKLRGPTFTSLMDELKKGFQYVIVGINKGRIEDYDYSFTEERAFALLSSFRKRYEEVHIYHIVRVK